MSDRSQDLDDLLAGIARVAGAHSPLPDPAAVRRLGTRRTARRRVVVSVVALALITGGAIATAGLGPAGSSTPSGKSSATPPPPSISSPSALPTYSESSSPSGSESSEPTSGTATPPGAQDPAVEAQAPPLDELIGIWQPADGMDRSLVIDSDGVLGIGQAGGEEYPMCAGRLEAAVGDSYPITVACSDYGTQGLTIGMDGIGDLTLNVPASSGDSAYTVAWVRTNLGGLVPNGVGSPVPTFLVGTWDSANSDESFTVTASGSVTWTAETQLGGQASMTGSVVQLADGTIRIMTSDGSLAEFWQVGRDLDGHITVDGGYGPGSFTLANPEQSTPASTNTP